MSKILLTQLAQEYGLTIKNVIEEFRISEKDIIVEGKEKQFGRRLMLIRKTLWPEDVL